MVRSEVSIMALSTSTGTFAPYNPVHPLQDRSKVENRNGRVLYTHDLNYQKLDPNEHVKWCRRNLGNRGEQWDFWMAGNLLYIEVWSDKAKFTYEMWKN